jgi:hypothetical protein
MATSADISTVRDNTNEPDDGVFTDEYIEGLIDSIGVDAASAKVWERKASAYAELVDVSEAGSSRKQSDLHKNALAMEAHYRGLATNAPTGPVSLGHAKTHQIVRST